MSRTGRVRAYLAAQEAALHAGDARLRAGDRTAVHEARVAIRRARSTLRTFPALARAEAALPLEDGLRSWGLRLGVVRDLEVLRETLAPVCSEPLRAVVEERLDVEESAAWERLVIDLLGEEHRSVLDALEEVVLAPAEGSIGARRSVRRADRMARRRLASAGPVPEEQHAARRAAKRARYAAEAIGDDALAEKHRLVQDRLGADRDRAAATAYLLRLDVGPELAEDRQTALERLAPHDGLA